MYISTNNYFESKNFVIHTFYGKETCFCWNDDKLVIFPYTNDNLAPVDVLTTPAPIRSILCFTSRIFITCIPHGIYKLSRDYEFAVLSKSAVGMGTVFYEVLIQRNKYLCLDNKQKMTSKQLFQMSSERSDSSKLCIYPMNRETSVEHFINAVTNDTSGNHLCIIVDEKRIFVLCKETVRIVYNSIYFIKDIIPVQRDSKTDGLLFLTDTDIIILMYSKDNALSFNKIRLGTYVQAICASFSQLMEDTLWFVCSDQSKLYYGKKQLSTDNIQQIRVQDKSFTCLQCYDSKIILGLTMNKQLVEFSVDAVEKTLSVEHDTFINLHPDMLKGTTVIMDKIYKGSQELHTLNESLTAEEDKLRRINLYAHKHKARINPKISINRMANQLFLSANLPDSLPKNSWVILNLGLECQNIYYMKKVDEDSRVDIHIPEDKAKNFSQYVIDLVTLKEEGQFWCLIRNYVTNLPLERGKKKKTRSSNKTNFIQSKIVILESFIKEGNISMKTLSEIKQSVRKELGYT